MAGPTSSLQRHERLRGVQVAKAILRDAFGLELTMVDARGPLDHQRGGVMTGSNELCRAVLFSREGFDRCDAFYRGIGADTEGVTRPCHLGLLAVAEPVIANGEPLGLLVVLLGHVLQGLRRRRGHRLRLVGGEVLPTVGLLPTREAIWPALRDPRDVGEAIEHPGRLRHQMHCVS